MKKKTKQTLKCCERANQSPKSATITKSKKGERHMCTRLCVVVSGDSQLTECDQTLKNSDTRG